MLALLISSRPTAPNPSDKHTLLNFWPTLPHSQTPMPIGCLDLLNNWERFRAEFETRRVQHDTHTSAS